MCGVRLGATLHNQRNCACADGATFPVIWWPPGPNTPNGHTANTWESPPLTICGTPNLYFGFYCGTPCPRFTCYVRNGVGDLEVDICSTSDTCSPVLVTTSSWGIGFMCPLGGLVTATVTI